MKSFAGKFTLQTMFVKGEYNTNLKLDLISKNEKINIGDLVVTSPNNELIPENILVGKIKKIQTSPTSLFFDILIDPLINYQKIHFVFVVLP